MKNKKVKIKDDDEPEEDEYAIKQRNEIRDQMFKERKKRLKNYQKELDLEK